MPFPDDFSGAAFDAAFHDQPEVTVRGLTDDELIVIGRVRAVQAALQALRNAPHVSNPGTNGDSYRDSLQIDGDGYCASLIAAIEAQPREEADAEECRIMEAQWEAGE